VVQTIQSATKVVKQNLPFSTFEERDKKQNQFDNNHEAYYQLFFWAGVVPNIVMELI